MGKKKTERVYKIPDDLSRAVADGVIRARTWKEIAQEDSASVVAKAMSRRLRSLAGAITTDTAPDAKRRRVPKPGNKKLLGGRVLPEKRRKVYEAVEVPPELTGHMDSLATACQRCETAVTGGNILEAARILDNIEVLVSDIRKHSETVTERHRKKAASGGRERRGKNRHPAEDDKILEYRCKGMSYQQIANKTGLSKSGVANRLRPYKDY